MNFGFALISLLPVLLLVLIGLPGERGAFVSTTRWTSLRESPESTHGPRRRHLRHHAAGWGAGPRQHHDPRREAPARAAAGRVGGGRDRSRVPGRVGR